MFGMNDAIDAAVLGAIVSFALVNLSEAIKRFHKMRSVAMAICAELGEIEKQFCWDLANQIVKAGERKLFINIKYSETYTTVFDSCVTCLDFFEVAEGAKIVALYMRIRDLLVIMGSLSVKSSER